MEGAAVDDDCGGNVEFPLICPPCATKDSRRDSIQGQDEKRKENLNILASLPLGYVCALTLTARSLEGVGRGPDAEHGVLRRADDDLPDLAHRNRCLDGLLEHKMLLRLLTGVIAATQSASPSAQMSSCVANRGCDRGTGAGNQLEQRERKCLII